MCDNLTYEVQAIKQEVIDEETTEVRCGIQEADEEMKQDNVIKQEISDYYSGVVDSIDVDDETVVKEEPASDHVEVQEIVETALSGGGAYTCQVCHKTCLAQAI